MSGVSYKTKLQTVCLFLMRVLTAAIMNVALLLFLYFIQ